MKSDKRVNAGPAKLDLVQWLALGFMSAWAVIVAIFYARHAFDWIGAILFNVPLLLCSRLLWESVSLGKDGISLSNEPPVTVLEDTVTALDSSLQRQESREPSEATPDGTVLTGRPEAASGLENIVNLAPRVPWDPVSIANVEKILASQAGERKPLLDEADPIMLFARLRIDIERQLRQMVSIAAMSGSTRYSASRMAAELLSRELLDSEVNVQLQRVLRVANAAIHGELKIGGEERVELADLGKQILNLLARLTSSPNWVKRAIASRARSAGQRASLVENDRGVYLLVNDIPIEVKRKVTNLSAIQNLTVVAASPPDWGIQFTDADKPIAWLVDDTFVGTAAAGSLAPWLFRTPPTNE